VSEATVTVRFDGPVLANHQMDVADLAPALLGLSELCRIANESVNGDRASVKVLIATDKEHQCFQFDLQVVQSIWESTKSVLNNADVASAKDLLEWIGLGATGVGGVFGLFKLLRWIKDRKVTSTEMIVKDGKNVVQIKIEGDNNVVNIYPETLTLLRNETVISNVKKVVAPVTREGYDKLEFESPKTGLIERIEKADAAAIASVRNDGIEESATDAPQIIEAWVTVYSPVYDPKAPKWRFKFGEVREYIDISATEIAAQAIKRGGALVDDAYRVRLEITQEHKPSGVIKNHYKIVEVLDFKPARLAHQRDAFKDMDDK
jgi:hypothetical protein